MSNPLKRLRYAQMNSSLGRRLLSLYYKEGSIHRVPMGPLKGCRLYYDRSVNFHAILGLWDLEGFEVLRKALVSGSIADKKLVVADVGANLGLITLWLSRLAAPESRIYAFEPDPTPLAILRRNLMLNEARNVEVVTQACSDRIGQIEFFAANHHHCSSLIQSWAKGDGGGEKKLVVPTTTLDAFFGEDGREAPDFIKMDIEGGGVFALEGCHRCIERKRPLLSIESHTPDEDKAISNLMVRHDYEAYRISNHRWVAKRDVTHPDPEGVWGHLLLIPKERVSKFRELLK